MIHWQIKFRSLRANELYTVSIYDDLYQGDPIQLRGGANPFETQEDDDRDFFKPVRTQTGYITIVDTGKDMNGDDFDWFDIIPAHAKDRKVVLTDSSNVVRWMGYIQPQTFSGNLYQPTQERKFPVMCPLQALASVNIPSTNLGVHTFAYVLDVILENTGMTFGYLNFQGYDPLNWLQKKVDWLNFLDKEDDGSYTGKYDCLTLLEEICKFWGWTCRIHEDDLWFVCPDDDLDPDYIGIEQSDLYDYLEAGQIPSQYQEGSWGSINTDTDIYATTENSTEVQLGIRKATIKADINKQQVITEIPYDKIVDMYKTDQVTTIHTDDHYDFRLHYYGSPAEYYFEDMHIDLNSYSSSSYNGYSAFLILDSYDGDISLKHNYDWQTSLGIMGTLINTAYEDDWIAMIESRQSHNYDHGVIAISGNVNCGGTLKCRLRVGDKWWNGSSWTTTKAIFNMPIGDEASPSSTNSGKIISNRQLNGIYNKYEGYGAAVGAAIGGKVHFEIVGTLVNGSESADGSGEVRIDNLKIQFVREKSYENYDDDRSENTYTNTTNKAFEDEVSIDTIFASDDLNAFGLGIIMNYDGTYCDHVAYTYSGGQSQVRPETHLLSRIINRGKYIRKTERIQVRSNLAVITPYKKCATAQMTGYPMAINHYWRDDITEAYIVQI